MKKIPLHDLACFTPFCDLFPIKVDPIYAQGQHVENHFGAIYHEQAQIWGHRDLVMVVLLAARRLHESYNWTLVIKDCLRTVEAQVKIAEAPISKANPQWFQDPPFMSSPGKGAHPRGMAVDIAVENVDMGTPVDCLTEEAGRNYTGFAPEILEKRKILEDAMVTAGRDLGFHVHPLSNEWWDFRFLPEIYNAYAPLTEDNLLPHQKMISEPQAIELVADKEILEVLRDLV